MITSYLGFYLYTWPVRFIIIIPIDQLWWNNSLKHRNSFFDICSFNSHWTKVFMSRHPKVSYVHFRQCFDETFSEDTPGLIYRRMNKYRDSQTTLDTCGLQAQRFIKPSLTKYHKYPLENEIIAMHQNTGLDTQDCFFYELFEPLRTTRNYKHQSFAVWSALAFTNNFHWISFIALHLDI